jgi:hypothetical protein
MYGLPNNRLGVPVKILIFSGKLDLIKREKQSLTFPSLAVPVGLRLRTKVYANRSDNTITTHDAGGALKRYVRRRPYLFLGERHDAPPYFL